MVARLISVCAPPPPSRPDNAAPPPAPSLAPRCSPPGTSSRRSPPTPRAPAPPRAPIAPAPPPPPSPPPGAAAIDLARHDEEKCRVIPIYLDQQDFNSKKVPYGLRLKHGVTVSEELSLAQCADRLLDPLQRLGPGGPAEANDSAKSTAPAAPKHDQRGIHLQPKPDRTSPVRRNPWRYVGCNTDETLFIGDHFNDEAVILNVDKAIAYPPCDVVAKYAAKISIEEDNLLAILPHDLVT